MASKQVREARARIAAFEAAIRAEKDAEAAAAKAAEPARKRKAALAKALARQPILTQAAAQPVRHISLHVGDTREESLARIGVSFGYGRTERPKAKVLAEELLSGGFKVTMGNGQDYTLRGALRRSVIVTPDQLVAVRAAERKYQRAKAALGAAAELVKTAYAEAFAAGTKPDPVAIAAQVAAHAAISDYPAPIDNAIREAAREASREIEVARLHLNWLVLDEAGWRKTYSQAHRVPNERPAECPCLECVLARQEADKVATLNARLDTLPTKLFDCPLDGHGRHRGPVERDTFGLTPNNREYLVKVRPELDQLLPQAVYDYNRPGGSGYPQVEAPRGWCRKGPKPVGIVLTGDWIPELQKAAKAAAKEAAKAAARKPKAKAKAIVADPEPGDTIDWTCPGCGEVHTSLVWQDDDGDVIVDCDDGSTYLADAVKVVSITKAAAAA